MRVLALLALLAWAPGCLAGPPASLQAAGRTWRLAHSELRFEGGKQVVSVHYTAAATGAPAHEGPWVSIWANYSREPGRPGIGNLMGIERLFDASEWKQDEVEYRRGGVERLETRRYIHAWIGPVEYTIWPQDADAMPVLEALLPGLDSLYTLTVRYISTIRFEQDGAVEERAVPEPGQWELDDRGLTWKWLPIRLRSGNPARASFRVESTRYIYGLREVRREPSGPVPRAPVVLGDKQQTLADRDGWARVDVPKTLPDPPPPAKAPDDTPDGEYVLVLTQLPPDVRVTAIPRYWDRAGIRVGCSLELNRPLPVRIQR